MFSFHLARQLFRNGAGSGFKTLDSISRQTVLQRRLFQTCIPRFNNKISNPNDNSVPKIDKLSLPHIPGEKRLTNELSDRIPKFPFSREAIPTLLPRPGVPRVGENGMTFSKMIHILKNKTEPELIYELEPHKLYFVICGCFALVFAFYAWNIGLISFKLAWDIFQENNLELPIVHQYINTIMQFILAAVLTSMPLLVMMVFIMAPTRLIRRMWYIPGEIEHVQFITHPILPSRPSPVITIPLENVMRAHRTKIWTGRGFYGTIDSSIFFFLREMDSRVPWIVDRKGFFWGDGRVHDYLFGKESIEDAERGLSMNDLLDILKERVQKGEEKLKKELGFGWRYKAQANLLNEDIKTLKEMITDKKLLKGASKKKRLSPLKEPVQKGEEKLKKELGVDWRNEAVDDDMEAIDERNKTNEEIEAILVSIKSHANSSNEDIETNSSKLEDMKDLEQWLDEKLSQKKRLPPLKERVQREEKLKKELGVDWRDEEVDDDMEAVDRRNKTQANSSNVDMKAFEQMITDQKLLKHPSKKKRLSRKLKKRK